MPCNKNRADQKRRCAANAYQHLAKHQHGVAGSHGRQRRAGNRHRKRGQHSAPHALQIDADAHKQLHGTKGKVKRASKQAEVLRAQVEIRLQRRGHDGCHRAPGLAERVCGG